MQVGDVTARNHGSQRRHRGGSDRHRQANVFGFCSGAPPFVPKRKTRSLWLPVWVVAVPAVTRSETRMRCVSTDGQVLASDVAARDVQAATSPANQIAVPEQSLGALRAAAQGKGESRSGKVRVFEWPPNRFAGILPKQCTPSVEQMRCMELRAFLPGLLLRGLDLRPTRLLSGSDSSNASRRELRFAPDYTFCGR
jgi:hypothetical protein